MSTDFEFNLRKHLEANPSRKRRAKRILAILDSKPSRRRTRRIEAMEKHVEAQLAASGRMKYWVDMPDWSAIDWAKLIDIILKLLLALLPFLLML